MAERQSRQLAVGLFAIASLWTGCTTTTARHTRNAPTGIAPHDGVVVLLGRFSDEFSLSKEKKFSRCVSDALRGIDSTVRVVSADDFRRAAFPDLTPEQVPPQPWGELVTNEGFRIRTGPLGLRYLISVSGRSIENWNLDGGGSGIASIWLFEVKRDSYVEGTVFDLKEGRMSGEVRVSVGGKTIWLYPPAPLVIPVTTEAHACTKIGEEVARLLSGEGPLEGTDTEPSSAVLVKAVPAPGILRSEELPARSVPEQTPTVLAKVEPAPIPSGVPGPFANIAGTWSGMIDGPESRAVWPDYTVTVTIREDGSYNGNTSYQRFQGIMKSADDQFRFKAITGWAMRHQTITVALREQDGKRTLKGTSEDGLTKWVLSPVKD